LWNSLVDKGVQDDTIVIVTSDNGAPTIFTDDGDCTRHRPNGDWRGQKGDLWDGGHREPLVVRWPGHVPSGSTVDDPICLTDLLPTLTAAAGMPVEAEDGVDIGGVLAGHTRLDPDRPLVHHSLGGRFALRSGRWKAIFSAGSGGGFSEPSIHDLFATGTGKAHPAPPWDNEHPDGQLYDVGDDPYERTNLWHQRPDVVTRMYDQLRGICATPGSGFNFEVDLSSWAGAPQ
jgi:arylsulfatase A-like enzyme